jgi:hypothetical protein
MISKGVGEDAYVHVSFSFLPIPVTPSVVVDGDVVGHEFVSWDNKAD